MKRDFQGRWVLVTGASSGLGQALARQLAKGCGAHLVVVARRAQRLESLREELESQYKIQVLPIAADMTQPAEVDRVFETATSGRTVDAVIFNAAVTFYGPAVAQSDAAFDQLLATNVSSVVRLSRRFARHFVQRGSGGAMMFVSSLAGGGPMPYQAAYAASKSFLTCYGLGLRHELKPAGISVTVLAPGGLATEMLESSGLSQKFKPNSVGMMSAERCAKTALEAFARGQALCIPGFLNRLFALWYRLAPLRMQTSVLGRLYRQPQWRHSDGAPGASG